MKGTTKNITLPDRVWKIIEDMVDGELVTSRGEAICHYLFKDPIFAKTQPNHIEITVGLNNSQLNQIDNKVEQTTAKTQPNGYVYDTTLTKEQNEYLKRNYEIPIRLI